MQLADDARRTGSRAAPGPHEHLVTFYDSQAFLTERVVDFLLPTLEAGQAAAVVATEEHRGAFAAGLRAAGVGVDDARRSGQLVAVDAERLLDGLLVDGVPDPTRFDDHVAPLVLGPAARGRTVRIYGEMVALLWERDDEGGVIGLEGLWNQLAARHSFELLCGYPMRAFDKEEHSPAFRAICGRHHTVLPTERMRDAPDARARHRAMATLEQEAVAGINARIALRRQQLTLEGDLARLEALNHLHDQLRDTMVQDLRAAAEGDTTRQSGVDSLQKTAVRQVRRLLRACDCTFTPLPDRPSADHPSAEHRPGGALVPVAAGGNVHGALHVRLDAARQLEEPERRFLHDVAAVLAAAFEHDAHLRQLLDGALHEGR